MCQPALARAVIDIPKRRHKNIRYLDESVKIRDYPERLRQVAVAGLGRDEPTLCLSNNFDVTAREVITRYVKRNGVEDALGITVNFFHLDCLASEVRLNVDLDVALTVIAHGCYRWLATRLPGYEKVKPKQAYQRLVGTGGVVEIQGDRLLVRFDKPRTTRFSKKPRSIGTVRLSHGWEDCAWCSSIPDASDKSNIVMGFLSAEVGVECAARARAARRRGLPGVTGNRSRDRRDRPIGWGTGGGPPAPALGNEGRGGAKLVVSFCRSRGSILSTPRKH